MSEYTDIRNNTYQIHQRSLVNNSQAEQQKARNYRRNCIVSLIRNNINKI